MKDIKIGDWVYSYSKGIYLIERIIPCYYDESDIELAPKGKQIGDEHDNRVVVVKRFLNSGYKKSLSYELCSDFFIRPLEEEAIRKVDEFIKQNPDSYSQFTNYKVPPIESLYNLSLNIEQEEKQLFEPLTGYVKQGKTYSQIIEKMQQLGLDKYISQHSSNAMLQLVNIEFETVDKKMIFRDAIIR